MSDSVNPTLSKIEDLTKSLLWDTLVDGELTALFVQVPWLAVWPIRQIITLAAHSFSDKLYSGLRTLVDMQALPFINDAHRKAFDDADVTLKIIAQDKGMDSPEYKKAKEDAKNALSQFVRFGGMPS